jgi:hypothetical protein
MYVSRLCVKYYFEEMAKYYSILVFLVVAAVAAASGNVGILTSSQVESGMYMELLYRYSYLFGFELLVDGAIRLGVSYFLNIHIGKEVSVKTIGNAKTRTLFMKMNLLMLLATYLTLGKE